MSREECAVNRPTTSVERASYNRLGRVGLALIHTFRCSKARFLGTLSAATELQVHRCNRPGAVAAFFMPYELAFPAAALRAVTASSRLGKDGPSPDPRS